MDKHNRESTLQKALIDRGAPEPRLVAPLTRYSIKRYPANSSNPTRNLDFSRNSSKNEKAESDNPAIQHISPIYPIRALGCWEISQSCDKDNIILIARSLLCQVEIRGANPIRVLRVYLYVEDSILNFGFSKEFPVNILPLDF